MGSGQRIHGNKDRSIGKIGHSAGKKTDQLGFDTKINPGDSSLRYNKRIILLEHICMYLLFEFETGKLTFSAFMRKKKPNTFSYFL